MTEYLEPLPRMGPRPPWGKAMAGSRHAWFADVRAYDSAESPVMAGTLCAAQEARLSHQRGDLCGLTLDRPRIMGILNVTPDSFSDGGDLGTIEAAVARAQAMDEADILDIGGESTRPGAETVPQKEEIARTVPVIRAIRDAGVSTPISIDTRKASVAEAALDAGADMVNDVSAMTFDSEMAQLIAERCVPICLMHAQGDPKTMQDAPAYEDVVRDVAEFLAERICAARSVGIDQDKILADPGIGFGKTVAHNLSILAHLSVYHDLGVPLLLGASRKRFIGTIGKADAAKERMPGSIAVALHGVTHGVQIIRVHDVAETRQALRLWMALNGDEWDA